MLFQVVRFFFWLDGSQVSKELWEIILLYPPHPTVHRFLKAKPEFWRFHSRTGGLCTYVAQGILVASETGLSQVLTLALINYFYQAVYSFSFKSYIFSGNFAHWSCFWFCNAFRIYRYISLCLGGSPLGSSSGNTSLQYVDSISSSFGCLLWELLSPWSCRNDTWFALKLRFFVSLSIFFLMTVCAWAESSLSLHAAFRVMNLSLIQSFIRSDLQSVFRLASDNCDRHRIVSCVIESIFYGPAVMASLPFGMKMFFIHRCIPTDVPF